MSQNNNSVSDNKKPALPKNWIVPIKLAVMAALAGCSAFVYFNVYCSGVRHGMVGLQNERTLLE